MKRLANLRKELPKKAKLNAFQVKSLKGGADKRRDRITNPTATASGSTTTSTADGS